MKGRYILGIVIATVVLILNQAFIQYWLAQKRFDANVINRSGKQRMLSQRINLEFCKWSYDDGNPELIEELYEEWSLVHYAFFTGSDELEIDAITDSKTKQLLDELSVNVEMIGSQVNLMRRPTQSEINAIDANQLVFLNKMNYVVKLLQEDSERKLTMIILIEMLLMIISLTIIILEVRFIFMPIEKRLGESNAELKLKNDQLKNSLADVELKNKELERFTFVAAHDLREPLVTVSSFVNLFETEYEEVLDETAISYLRFIGESTERMNQLVQALLHLSRIGNEKNLSKVDFNQMLKQVQSDVSVLIQESGAQLKIGNLPVLQSDEVEFRLLFQNLISNAVKFRKADSVIEISVTALSENEGWKFSVADNGIGIAEKDQSKVFDIFHRLHVRSEYEGTGIGLALCRKIVDGFGGRIWVESAPNVGSTFFFTIPNQK